MALGSAVQPHAEQAVHKAEEAALHQHLGQQQSARNAAAAHRKNVTVSESSEIFYYSSSLTTEQRQWHVRVPCRPSDEG